jgi:hypothetical protein
MRRIAAIAVALCALVWATRAARADRAAVERADQMFKKGKKLLADHKYAEACVAFEDSDRLDTQIGAKLNVARCYQDWGKLATAWRWYIDAEQMAIKAGDDRARKIRLLIDQLDPTIPRIILQLPPDAITDRVAIQLDDAAIALGALADERRVDPGPHRVDVIIDGVKRTQPAQAERGDRVQVVLDVPTRHKPAPRVVVTAEPPDPGRNRRLLGLGVSGAGAVAMVIAGITTLNAHSDYEHALTGYCMGHTNMCDETGLARTHSARHRANIATAVTLFGMAAVAGGLALYFTAPHAPGPASTEHALRRSPRRRVLSGAISPRPDERACPDCGRRRWRRWHRRRPRPRGSRRRRGPGRSSRGGR